MSFWWKILYQVFHWFVSLPFLGRGDKDSHLLIYFPDAQNSWGLLVRSQGSTPNPHPGGLGRDSSAWTVMHCPTQSLYVRHAAGSRRCSTQTRIWYGSVRSAALTMGRCPSEGFSSSKIWAFIRWALAVNASSGEVQWHNEISDDYHSD